MAKILVTNSSLTVDPVGKKVFWHSSAHVLGEATELHYGCHLCMGPPTDDGYYYEMAIENRVVLPSDFPALQTLSDGAIKQKQKFERLVVSKENLLKMFEVMRQGISNPLCSSPL